MPCSGIKAERELGSNRQIGGLPEQSGLKKLTHIGEVLTYIAFQPVVCWDNTEGSCNFSSMVSRLSKNSWAYLAGFLESEVSTLKKC